MAHLVWNLGVTVYYALVDDFYKYLQCLSINNYVNKLVSWILIEKVESIIPHL